MGTYTRSHSFTAGEKPTEAQWNVDIDGLITLCNGQIDKANVDSSSTDGIVTMDEAQTLTGRKAFSGNIAAELTIDTVANAAGSVQDVLTLEWDPGDGANLTDNSSGISLLYKMPDDADNQDDFAALTCMVVSDATGSEEGEFSFRLVKAGSLTEIATLAPTTGLTVGVDNTGYDVKFFGDTSGQFMLWDESADELVLAGDSKLSFHDAAGGENIIASSDGHLEVNAGTTLDITAPTVDLNSSTKFNIDTAAYDLNASGAVTIDSAGVSIDSSAASNLTTSGGALTITSAAAATWSTAAGALTINGTGGVNVQEGGATIIGISDSRVLSTSNTASIDMDATGAVQINSSGGAISVANDNVDQTVNLATAGTRTLNIGILDGTDTTTITSKGNQTHSGTITVGVDNTGYDVKFFGDTSGSSLLWDESADDLIFTNAGIAVGSDATGDVYYRNSSGFLTRLAVGSDADVLTLASGVPSWASPTSGDITGVTAGNGLSGGGTSGGVTLALDLSELTDTAIANGDYIVFTDTTDSNATVKGDLADVATLFAGTGLTASSSVISIDAAQTGIDSLLATDIKIGEDDQTKIDFGTANQINFVANNSTAMEIDSSQNTILKPPDGGGLKFYAGGTGHGNYIRWSDDSGSNNQGSIGYDHSTNAMYFFTSVTEAMRIDSTQNVGIGTTTHGTHADWTSLSFGGNAFIQTQTAKGATKALYINHNSHLDTDGSDEYISTDEASSYGQRNGQHVFRGVASGTAGNDITWVTGWTINPDGKVYNSLDNSGIHTGADNDLRMYHTDAHGFLDSDKGNLYLDGADDVYLRVNGTETALRAVANDGIHFYDDGNLVSTYDQSTWRFDFSAEGALGSTATLEAREDTQGAAILQGWHTDGTTSKGIDIYYATAHNAANSAFATFRDSGNAARAVCYSNGNWQNFNNSYGSSSDVKLKQDIVDARDYWNDFEQIRFRKFRFKTAVEADSNAPFRFGVVAQEFEEIFPGLVEDYPDTDDDAQGTFLGTYTKGVKYSVLSQIGLKVLQEAQTRIEALEAQVAALQN